MARVGTSGWSYDHWKGVLYPPRLPAGARLETYFGEFDTVELNASFYRWPPPARFASWRPHFFMQRPGVMLVALQAPEVAATP